MYGFQWLCARKLDELENAIDMGNLDNRIEQTRKKYIKDKLQRKTRRNCFSQNIIQYLITQNFPVPEMRQSISENVRNLRFANYRFSYITALAYFYSLEYVHLWVNLFTLKYPEKIISSKKS